MTIHSKPDMIKRTMGAGMPFLAADSPFRVFFAPDTGANATAGTGGQGSSQPNTGAAGQAADETSQPAGQQQQQAQSPWDNINLDELDDSTRRVIEAAKADHQRVAGENATLRQQNDERTRQETQRQQQQQQQPSGQQQQQQQENPVDKHVRATLKARGFTDQQIEQQAGVFTDMLGGMLPMLRDQLGRDFAPLANTVVSHENEGNFRDAMQSEHGVRLFANEAVAQEVWNIVEQRTAAGQTFDQNAILNLAKMIYFDKGGSTETSQQQQQPQQTGSSFFPQVQTPATPNRSTGGSFNYPGAGFTRPIANGNAGNGAQGRHAVNEDTRAALAVTFNELSRTTGVAPAAFPSDMARHGAGARKK